MQGNFEMQGLANPVLRTRHRPHNADVHISIDSRHHLLKRNARIVYGRWAHAYWEKDGSRVAVHRHAPTGRWLLSTNKGQPIKVTDTGWRKA